MLMHLVQATYGFPCDQKARRTEALIWPGALRRWAVEQRRDVHLPSAAARRREYVGMEEGACFHSTSIPLS